VTYPPGLLDPESGGDVGNDGFQQPVPLRSLRTIRGSKRRYDLTDLTISSWIGLARRLGNGKESGLRKEFKRYLNVEGSEDG
jgi:endopolyphosphatase